jgi:hypothetical protein
MSSPQYKANRRGIIEVPLNSCRSLAGEMTVKYFMLFAADALKAKDFHELL